MPRRGRHELLKAPGKLALQGAIAQLGERLLCKQEVTGSIPVGSTREVAANGWVLARSGALREGWSASKCGAAAQPLPNERPKRAVWGAPAVHGSRSQRRPGEGRPALHREQSTRLGAGRGECCLSSDAALLSASV